MTKKVAVVMDAIESITTYKDTTFAMLLEIQRRGWEIHYIQQKDLYLRDGNVHANAQILTVEDNTTNWFQLQESPIHNLSEVDVILMRKDPPFNMDYIYTTYLLELVEKTGVLVVNTPQSLRDANEKLFTAWFPQCCPPTLVTRNIDLLKEFKQEYKDIIFKPLDGMGGQSVFRIRENDPNLNVIIETLTEHGQHNIMAQKYIPQVKDGDKRIILIDGKPIPYALARIPAEGETRANLAAGGTGVGVKLTPRDHWICEQVGPSLRDKGLIFVGLDVIGDYLTEINVTSPTCTRELDAEYGLNISGQLMDCIESYLAV